MIKNKYGRIVNVSSATGPLVSNPGETAYSVAKAAMIGMSHSLAIEVAKYNIPVKNVTPGCRYGIFKYHMPLVPRTLRYGASFV